MNASFLRKTLCALLGSCVLATTVPAADDSAELEYVRATVSEMFEGIEADDIFASEVDGWYTVRKGAIIAYVSSDGRYLMQGDIIDLEESVNLSEESRNDARAKMMSAVPERRVNYVHTGNSSPHGQYFHRY